MRPTVPAFDLYDRRVKPTHVALLVIGSSSAVPVAVPEEREIRRWLNSSSPVLTLNTLVRKQGVGLVVTLDARFTLAGVQAAQLYRDGELAGDRWSVRLVDPGEVELPEGG